MVGSCQAIATTAVVNHILIVLAVAVIQCLHFSFSFFQSDLGGNHWVVSNEGRGIHDNASVPGSMYTAVLPSTGKFAPLYRDNDVKYKWIGRTDWNYSSSFDVSSSTSIHREIKLICEGLDTVATVYVNGQKVGQSDNMFVHSTYNIKNLIKTGTNAIRIEFKSAVLEASSRTSLYAYVIPPECPLSVQHGECHVNLIRKEQCSFSWDWGPSFPTQGVWKPMFLNIFNTAVITSISAVPHKVKDQWIVTVETTFDVTRGPGVKGQIKLDIPELLVYEERAIFVSQQFDQIKFNLTVPKQVPLWWPRGYGEQKLFNLTVTLTTDSEKSFKSLMIGFRTVELIQEPVSNNVSQGLTFYFKINGLPIFLKGSNWIPADNFQEKITDDHIWFLLKSAADVGMNAMRVWGGGIYESDYFYHAADQLGIMIWQDLMFSVALYPGKGHFLDSVTQEITQQLHRLKHHPSIIIWAGSNENEKALRQNWFHTDNYTLYYKDFITLYVKTIKPVVLKEDTSRPYLVSSPTDGAESVKEGYVAKDPGSELYGDIHFYDYIADQWDPSVFRIPRAATEYGIQSWCNSQSLEDVFEEDDYDMNGDMATHRQHHGLGNIEMMGEIGLHMNIPSSQDKKTKFLDFIYYTQINQAMSMRTQTEHYRRHQSKLLPDGRGLTMAALYWQLNDIWQAPTWASIDYSGRWKMLHYFSKSFFSPTLISPFLDEKKVTLTVYMVVDEIPVTPERTADSGSIYFRPMTSMAEIVKSNLPIESTFKLMNKVSQATSGHLTIQMYNYNSFTPLHIWDVSYKMNSTSESIFEKSVDTMMTDAGCPSRSQCLLYFMAATTEGKLMSSSWMTFTYPKDSKLSAAHITIESVSSESPTLFKIDLSSNAIALYTWLSTSNIHGVFSDNGFLIISQRKSVYFYSQTPTTIEKLKGELSVKTIVDVKYSGQRLRTHHHKIKH